MYLLLSIIIIVLILACYILYKKLQYEKSIVKLQEKDIDNRNETIRQKNEKIKELKEKEILLKMTQRIATVHKGGKIVDYQINKAGLPLYVIEYENENAIDIYLAGELYQGTNSLPRVITLIHTDSNGNKYLEHCDIYAIDRQYRNGTILECSLENAAKKHGIKYIKGNLVPDRNITLGNLVKFYERNGYKVNLNDEGTGGRIYKELINDDSAN